MSSFASQARSRVPRLAEAAVARARLTVVPRQHPSTARVPFLVLVSVLLVSGVAGLLLFNTSMQQDSFTATALEQRASTLDSKAQVLQMKLERLRAPQRLAERARRLGMVPPPNPAFLRLSDGAVLGNPQPATAADGFRVGPAPVRKPADLTPPPIVVRQSSSQAQPSGAAQPSDQVQSSGPGQSAGQRNPATNGDTGAASADQHASPGRKKAHHGRNGHGRAH